MNTHTNKLMELVDAISIEDIKKLFEKKGFYLVNEVKTEINTKHALYGLVFSRKNT